MKKQKKKKKRQRQWMMLSGDSFLYLTSGNEVWSIISVNVLVSRLRVKRGECLCKDEWFRERSKLLRWVMDFGEADRDVWFGALPEWHTTFLGPCRLLLLYPHQVFFLLLYYTSFFNGTAASRDFVTHPVVYIIFLVLRWRSGWRCQTPRLNGSFHDSHES